jgi:hypothetical protein
LEVLTTSNENFRLVIPRNRENCKSFDFTIVRIAEGVSLAALVFNISIESIISSLVPLNRI